ncbi:MAG: hypothetical protein ACK5A9_06240, partial [Pseudanabaena sp.]
IPFRKNLRNAQILSKEDFEKRGGMPTFSHGKALLSNAFVDGTIKFASLRTDVFKRINGFQVEY